MMKISPKVQVASLAALVSILISHPAVSQYESNLSPYENCIKACSTSHCTPGSCDWLKDSKPPQPLSPQQPSQEPSLISHADLVGRWYALYLILTSCSRNLPNPDSSFDRAKDSFGIWIKQKQKEFKLSEDELNKQWQLANQNWKQLPNMMMTYSGKSQFEICKEFLRASEELMNPPEQIKRP